MRSLVINVTLWRKIPGDAVLPDLPEVVQNLRYLGTCCDDCHPKVVYFKGKDGMFTSDQATGVLTQTFFKSIQCFVWFCWLL